MKAAAARSRVRAAQLELAAAEQELALSMHPVRARWRTHRTAIMAAVGFVGGFALTLLPTRWWTRIGAAAGTVAAVAARSVFTPAVVGVALSRKRRDPAEKEIQAAA